MEIATFDGSRRVILNYAVPIRDAGGALAGAVAAALDISDRKAGEAALADSERRFRHMADHAPVMVWVTDPSGYCTFLSRSWQEFTGQRPEEGLGYGWLEAVHPDDRERTGEIFRRANAERQAFSLEYRIRHRGGGYRWAIDAAAPWWDEDGRPLGYVGSVIDIDDRKRIEARLRELNDTLEQRVLDEVDARRQAQEQLLQSQKIESLGQLTGGVAHDFNNILAAMITSLELALRRGRDPALARLLENALRAARRGARLVDQLMAFARKQRLAPRPCDLSQLIAGFAELLRRAAGSGVRLRLELDEDLWLVRSDVAQFENALLNLVLNARDAMPDGGELWIRTRNVAGGDPALPRDLAAGEYVEVAVEDAGSGMPAEVAAKAFDPFYTTKPPGRGTGLGLSQVYGFVKQSGGSAAIRSRFGAGTRISLYLPRSPEALLPEAEARPVPPPALPGGARLLVVDDDEVVRSALREMLTELGLSAEAVADPEEGLRRLREEGPWDALLADYAMPVMTGTELIRQAREALPGLPCLLITGYVQDESARESPEVAGALRKPFSAEQLLAALGRLLQV